MTLSWLFLSLLYLAGLFWIGRWGDRASPLAKKLTSHPVVYSLALAIYCTAWTYFGAVGEAARNTWQYLPILLGPALVYLFGYRFIRKLISISKKQHITTISDFISSRYGKRQTVALLVTIIALLATIPYVALQLKAISSAFQLVTGQSNGQVVVLMATLFIALFSIYFGTQRTDVTEYRRGLMLAIAFESSIKLLALVVMAAMAFFWWQADANGAMLQPYMEAAALSNFHSFSFVAQTVMAAAAVICLPRQFHVAIVDNLDLNHLKTARWVFPLYLAITALTIPVIATAGNTILAGTGAEPDTYVLNLAILADSSLIKMLVFVGGLSAATAMIIVATLTLSTMLTNDVILPNLLNVETQSTATPNYTRKILTIRRFVIAGLLLLAYLYHQQMVGSRSLASIGLIAFSLVVQLLPAIVGGMYWKRGHAHGVYAGLLSGVTVWLLWLVIPLFSLEQNAQIQSDTISIGAMLSLAVNTLAYVAFSITAPVRLVDRIQAQAFVSPAQQLTGENKNRQSLANVGDLKTLLATFLGEPRSTGLIKEYSRAHNLDLADRDLPTEPFIAFCERALGGVLGSSSAKAIIDSAMMGKKLDVEEVVNFIGDTTQALKFNTMALFTSIESLDQGISVVDKELKLVAWNRRYLDLFDYPQGMVEVGTPLETLVRYNAQRGECGIGNIDNLVNKRLEHIKRGHSHRFLRQRSDGRVIEMVGNPLPGGGYVTSFNDITSHIEVQKALKDANIDLENLVRERSEEVQAINGELRQEIERRASLEEELVQARHAAEQANASKTRFLALASHDVLQPLNAAKLYLSAMNEMEASTEMQDIVGKLTDSVSSSEALIATLLDIARLDQDDMQPTMESVSVREVLGPLLDEYAMQASKKGLGFKAHIPDLWVSADKTYLYRIVQNLLSNAIKYTAAGRVVLGVRKQGEAVHFQVWDTGPGIAEHERAKIFSDFYRITGETARGVGLGLGVVTRLSEKMGADIRLTSQPDRGSCFAFSLTKSDMPANNVVKHRVDHNGIDGLSVLCVDDKQENLDAMRTLLSKWGVCVHLALNQSQALAKFDTHRPDVLLMDYQLSNDEDGLQVISRLRERAGQALPAALVTANKESELKERCLTMDVSYLAKPVKPAKLRSLLLSLYRQAKNGSARESA